MRIPMLMTSLPAKASDNHSIVIYYYGECPRCVHYSENLDQASRSVGITNVTKVDYSYNERKLDPLRNLREEFDVPRELFRSVATVVDGKYLFEGYFPTDLMVRFVASNPNAGVCDSIS